MEEIFTFITWNPFGDDYRVMSSGIVCIDEADKLNNYQNLSFDMYPSIFIVFVFSAHYL